MRQLEVVLHPSQREGIYHASLNGETIVSDSPMPMKMAAEELLHRKHPPGTKVAFRFVDEREPFTTKILDKVAAAKKGIH